MGALARRVMKFMIYLTLLDKNRICVMILADDGLDWEWRRVGDFGARPDEKPSTASRSVGCQFGHNLRWSRTIFLLQLLITN